MPASRGIAIVEWRIGRLRHLIWNGYHDEAHDELFGMRHMASEVSYLNGEKFRLVVACGALTVYGVPRDRFRFRRRVWKATSMRSSTRA